MIGLNLIATAYNMGETSYYIINKTLSVFEPSSLKYLTSGALSVLFFFFGNLYTDALVAIAMLMLLDFFLGMAASKYEDKPLTSRRAADSVKKGIIYFTAISAGYFADLTIPFNVIQATMVGFVGATEFISILENVGRMGYDTPKKLLNQLKDFKKHQ